jgi:RNA polymerase sigma-70 factor (ECF subfamily)
MAAAQRGEVEPYRRLLEALLPEIRRFAVRRLRDLTAAEDVVQNVLLSLHRARHTYRPERPFEPWIWAIARNALIDAQRSRRARAVREVPLEEALESAEAEPVRSLAISPELRRALESIPAAQRQAVELVQIEGLSVAEAAARAGTTAGALKVRAHRGYRALRRLLGTEPT